MPQDDWRQIYHRVTSDNYTTGRLETNTGQWGTNILQMLGDKYTVVEKMYHKTFGDKYTIRESETTKPQDR